MHVGEERSGAAILWLPLDHAASLSGVPPTRHVHLYLYIVMTSS